MFPATAGRSEPGQVEDPRIQHPGVLHRIRPGVVTGLLMAVLAGLLMVFMACYQPADDTDNDPPTNVCGELTDRTVPCEGDG